MTGFALAAAVVLAGCSTSAGAANTGTPVDPNCQTVTIAVTVPAASGQGQLSGLYCRPAGTSPTTVVLAVHGGTYNHDYWAWPMEPDTYNFTDKAAAAGYAVLAIDRLGDGQSTRPPSAQDTTAAQVSTLDQAVQALRAGRLGVAYQHVLWVGHSYGSYYGVALAAAHPADLDALVLTGFGSHISAQTQIVNNADMVPANYLPRFAGLDPGYQTDRPGTRANQLADGPDHAAPHEDPAIIAFDQATEDVLSTAEQATRPKDLGPTLAAFPDLPVLVMDGNEDEHYCEPDVYSCASTHSWFDAEAASFPKTPCLAGQLMISGHDVQLSTAAPAAARSILDWAATTLPPNATAARCTVRGALATSGIPLG